MIPDDPKLTAYALGELSGAERDEVEARLAADPALRAEADAIRAVAGRIGAVLAAEPARALDPARREAISAPPAPRRAGSHRRVWFRVTAAAVVLFIAVGVGARVLLRREPEPAELVVRWVSPTNTQEVNLEGVAESPSPPSGPSVGARRGDRLAMAVVCEDGITYDVFDYRVHEGNTEAYDSVVENAWVRPAGEAALSTFSIDVDTASYALVRRFLSEENRLPPKGAVRIEEMVNYFRYDLQGPANGDPFAVLVDAAAAPWEPRHRLVRIALQAREVPEAERPPTNLVFLLDVSGSMEDARKLPLVKRSIAMLVERLRGEDRVAIVVYAGASGLVLPSTTGDRRAEILAALENLQAGGSTNGGSGIELAYRVAEEHFIPGGVNRVILATDGDFNVGVTNQSELVDLIERKAKSKVFLTALGFGVGNIKDSTLEKLADKGNGNYAYIDSLAEARKVLVEQAGGTLQTVAKDVKIQVEWNPAHVAAYRLVGYENRMLAAQDFADDRKDAGEIGAGHTVTAFYEVVPAGEPVPGAKVDDLRYQTPPAPTGSPETLTVKLRFKEPEGDASVLREQPFEDLGIAFDGATEDFRFAAAVAEFGLLLRELAHRGSANYDAVREIAASALGRDEGGWRAEFLTLVAKAAALAK